MSNVIALLLLLAYAVFVSFVPFTAFTRIVSFLLPIPLTALAIIGETWLIVPALLSTVVSVRLKLGRYGHKRERRLLIRSANMMLLATVFSGFMAIFIKNWTETTYTIIALLAILIGLRAFVLSVFRTSRHGFST